MNKNSIFTIILDYSRWKVKYYLSNVCSSDNKYHNAGIITKSSQNLYLCGY